MRIVHIITRFARAGSERNLVQFMEWEHELGHHVHLFVGGDPDPTLLPSWLPWTHVPHLQRKLDPVTDARGLLALRRAVRVVAPDLVHTHQSKAGVLGRIAAQGLAPLRIHTVHMTSFGPSYGRASTVLLAAERLCARRTDLMVSVGRELRDVYLRSGVGRREDYRVIPSALDVERFLQARGIARDEQSGLRADAGIPNDVRVLVTAGALEPRKRHALIIRQLAPLLRRKEAILVIAGDGPLRPQLIHEAADVGAPGAVRLAGHVPDLERVYAMADVYVHAATAEGVPQVVIQALGAGLRVAATDTTGLREVAGAPVEIARPDGGDLEAAVQRALDRPDDVVAPEDLRPWTRAAVRNSVVELHAELARRLAVRTAS